MMEGASTSRLAAARIPLLEARRCRVIGSVRFSSGVALNVRVRLHIVANRRIL